MKKSALIAFAIASLSLSACVSDKPSAGDFKTAFNTYAENCSVVELESYEKLNGMQQGNDPDEYVLHMKWVVSYKGQKDAFEFKKNCSADLFSYAANNVAKVRVFTSDHDFHNNQKIEFTGPVFFHRTDNGWLAGHK